MKPVLFFCFLICQTAINSQTCLPEGYIFDTQVRINNFPSNYPGCTQILGNVEIKGNITNLDGLANLTYIGGYLNIQVQSSANLTGLNNIDSVGGHILINGNQTGLNCLNKLEYANNLTIQSNPALTSLDCFSNLKAVSDMSGISANPLLESIQSLSNLENIASGGKFTINQNPKLTNLAGLQKLSQVDGSITIAENERLTNLDSLINLTSVRGTLIISSNPSLKDLSGLDNLTKADGLVISSNDSLTSTQHLSKLEEVDYLRIMKNPALINLGLNALKKVNSGLTISENRSLEELGSFGFQDTLEGGVSVSFNPNLTNIEGLINLSVIKGGIGIYGNESLSNLNGLNNLHILKGLEIGACPALLNLHELSQLDSISNRITLTSLPLLTGLEGLENLRYIGKELHIEDNNSLTSLQALQNLRHAETLRIINNPSLASLSGIDSVEFTDYWIRVIDNPLISACNIPSICNVMADFGGWSFYSGNAPGCNSRDEVYISCGLSDTEEQNKESLLRLYPNPTAGFVTIETDAPLSKACISDSTGRFSGTLDLSNGSRTLDLSALAKGVYFIRFMIGEQMVVRKVVKM